MPSLQILDKKVKNGIYWHEDIAKIFSSAFEAMPFIQIWKKHLAIWATS